jgi:hypothetical protein
VYPASVQDWARAVDQASEPTRHADRDTLTAIHTQLRQAAQDVAASLHSARAAEVQRQCLLWAFAGGVLAGMTLGVIAIGPAVHAIL